MKAYQVIEHGKALEERTSDNPAPTGQEVLIRTIACGVCHSDLHLYEGEFDLGGGNKLPSGTKLPFTLGHEIIGEVVAIGDQVTGVVIGDQRVVYPWIGCGNCSTCERGDEHICNKPRSLGVNRAGGFADHVLIPDAKYLFDKGDIADELACTYACSGLTAYSALKKVGAENHQEPIVIVGAGGVGMMALQIATAVFNMAPIVVDIDESKLEAARAAGAKAVVNSTDADAIAQLRELTNGGAFAVLDFVGAEASIATGLGCLRKGGRLIVVGLFGGSLNFPIPFFPMMSRRIEGSFVGSPSEMQELMDLVKAGKIAPIPIDKRPLSEADAALNDLKQGKVIGRTVLCCE